MGKLLVISAPSGTGKNTIIRELLKLFPNTTRLVTTTTRDPRPGEKNGVDYHFVTEVKFQDMLARGEFLESNNYAGNWYGSERQKLEQDLEKNEFVFSTLDVNGKKSLDKISYPHIAIFLLPDSIDTLDDRIRHRGGESEEDIVKRIAIAHDEMALADTYDFQVVNTEGKMYKTVEQIQEFLKQYQSNERITVS
ncbi:MAG: guanylate kinase [Candidatus Magasanikbacteria bacterium RIFCSPHIGHO2_02_FULL_41_13]|uniref:Guanylate kinase n=1 Tax=Candidatus Magasanikbacteria bacterium RIFCSPHIGHO2_02_FULL_41_13 TaxID=1798676 RepID=A0A1F6M4S4_9BACT|nr:MAG: guanylate kinase [Candidatus Magasanikbacteria bacterium RIFCSPHIGHO2_02_FULL_41_13]